MRRVVENHSGFATADHVLTLTVFSALWRVSITSAAYHFGHSTRLVCIRLVWSPKDFLVEAYPHVL